MHSRSRPGRCNQTQTTASERNALAVFLQGQSHFGGGDFLQAAEQAVGHLGKAMALAQQGGHKAGQVGGHFRIGQGPVSLASLLEGLRFVRSRPIVLAPIPPASSDDAATAVAAVEDEPVIQTIVESVSSESEKSGIA